MTSGKSFAFMKGQGVKEYWIVDPDMNSVEVYSNEGGHFSLITKIEGGGRVGSSLLKSFEIDIKEIFKTI